MLLKIGETVFINAETIMAVDNFYSDSIEEDNDELFEEVGDYDDEEEFDEDEINIKNNLGFMPDRLQIAVGFTVVGIGLYFFVEMLIKYV